MTDLYSNVFQVVQQHCLRLAPAYRATENAPDTWEALQADYEAWKQRSLYGDVGGYVIPVSNQNMSNTIFPLAAGNLAQRAWHDTLHLLCGLEFTYTDEMTVGWLQTETFRKRGAGELAAMAIYFDTCGQTIYNDTRGQFPEDQKGFVIKCMEEVGQFPAATAQEVANKEQF